MQLRVAGGLTRGELVMLLRDDAAFRAALAKALADAPFEAFCWEMPATSSLRQDREAEMVVVDSPALAHARADPTDFAALFAAAKGRDALAFPNLGGDAMLVVPTPKVEPAVYPHLATFVRRAPPSQIDALLREVALTIERQLSPRPLWVSTAGLGVSWVHVRLDSRPKYYRHAPYKAAP